MKNMICEYSGFSLFGLEIKYYGIIMAISFAVALLVAIHLAKKKGMNENLPYVLLIIVFPLAVIGARLYYVIFSGREWTFAEILDIRSGGLAIYGGIIFSLIGIIVYSLIKKQNILKNLDLIAPCLILAQAIGRWGNFFNQEAYGTEVTNPSFQWFPFSVYIEIINEWHLATFFYESLWCLLGFVLIYLLYKRTEKTGLSTAVYLVFYGTGRFFIEQLRTDSLYVGATSLRVSQIVSGVMVVLGVAYLIYLLIKHKKYPSPAQIKISDNTDIKNTKK